MDPRVVARSDDRLHEAIRLQHREFMDRFVAPSGFLAMTLRFARIRSIERRAVGSAGGKGLAESA